MGDGSRGGATQTEAFYKRLVLKLQRAWSSQGPDVAQTLEKLSDSDNSSKHLHLLQAGDLWTFLIFIFFFSCPFFWQLHLDFLSSSKFCSEQKNSTSIILLFNPTFPCMSFSVVELDAALKDVIQQRYVQMPPCFASVAVSECLH